MNTKRKHATADVNPTTKLHSRELNQVAKPENRAQRQCSRKRKNNSQGIGIAAEGAECAVGARGAAVTGATSNAAVIAHSQSKNHNQTYTRTVFPTELPKPQAPSPPAPHNQNSSSRHTNAKLFTSASERSTAAYVTKLCSRLRSTSPKRSH